MADELNPYAAPQTTEASGTIPPDAKVYAACPNCRNVYAKPIGYTLWGGALGPRLFTHVRCCQCRTKYNGKTGQSNFTNIVIYLTISFVIALACLAAFAVATLFKN
jgi:hypothetical protein